MMYVICRISLRYFMTIHSMTGSKQPSVPVILHRYLTFAQVDQLRQHQLRHHQLRHHQHLLLQLQLRQLQLRQLKHQLLLRNNAP